MASRLSVCVLSNSDAEIRNIPVDVALATPSKTTFANGDRLRTHYALHTSTVLVDVTQIEHWDLMRPYDVKIALKLLDKLLVSCSVRFSF